MTGKKLSKILAVILAAALLGGCGTHKSASPSAPLKAPAETIPAVTQAPARNDSKSMTYQTFGYNYCIHNDGTVSIRNDDGIYTPVQDEGWTDIVAVVQNDIGFVALKADGTIVTTQPEHPEAQIISQWENIIHIHSYCGYSSIVGLSADGEVFYAGDNPVITQWKDIVQLADGYYGLFGLKADGTVVSENTEIDLSGWTDIIHLAEGQGFLAGLRSDGTVLVSAYDDALEKAVSGWRDVEKISAYNELMALRSDGTVMVTSTMLADMAEYFEVAMDPAEWTDVVDICHWGASFMGLRSDGTLLAAGMNEGGQLNVGHWNNIQAMWIDYYCSFALTEDGTLLQSLSEYDTEGKEIVATNVRYPGK